MASNRKNTIEGRAKRIKLLLLDVDGVMTDGGIIYSDAGEELKVFNVRDGHGIKLLMKSGIDVGIVTARTSGAVAYRAKNLGIEMVYQGQKNKLDALKAIMKEKRVKDGEIAFMGDDLVDLPIITRVGLSSAPSDAVDEVKSRVHYVAGRPGGRGAVRELAELILKSKGLWDKIVKGY